MNTTLESICNKFAIDLNQPSPIVISFSRWSMPSLLEELNLNIGAEIGTEHGSYAEKLCQANPKIKLYCIDPWSALPYYEGYKEQQEVNSFYETAKRKLAPFNCEILKMTSMEAVKRFKANSLDFVFIDGNHHFEFVVNDIIYWSRIVRPGGIVYGHDYSDQFHVREAVNAYMAAHKIKPWFILHKKGLIDSWMYIRQEEDVIFYS